MKEEFSVVLTAKELNYIDMALIERIRGLEESIIRDAGNVPHIREFSRKTVNKLRALRGHCLLKHKRKVKP